MKFFSAHIRNYLPIIVISLLFGAIFFYHLDYSTLESWDEAWYGSISRGILLSSDPLHMVWNGKPYLDHPPMGFWLMAVSMKVFGVNEFGARFPSAILGVGTLLLLYAMALKLFGKKSIALCASLIMGTSVWFVLRARSGNLDSTFAFFYALTIYLSLLSSKKFSLFPLVGLSFGALMLSKTLAGLSALPVIFLFNAHNLLSFRRNISYALLAVVAFLLLVLPWYQEQIRLYSYFKQYHFQNIGTRNRTYDSYFNFAPASQVFFYLHMGVRKWYKLWIAGFVGLILSRKIIKKQVLSVLLWTFFILFPFVSSEETHIWHLIPVYIPLSLLTAYGVYEGFMLTARLFQNTAGKLGMGKLASFLSTQVTTILYVCFIASIAFVQVKVFAAEVFPEYPYQSDGIKISRELSKYDQKIFLDDDFFPAAVFYSGKRILPMYDLSSFGETSDKRTLSLLFQNEKENFIAVTRNWALKNLDNENIPYKVLERNDSFSIVTKPDQ